ncbi:MAG: hypothetical protein Q8K00_14380, partial [Syntrophales bacterium]|nr:hypothetical protein [Syntrophales bacterium]
HLGVGKKKRPLINLYRLTGAAMALMPPEKFIIFDYSGTLSLEAPRFGRPETLVRALKESGLATLGVSTPEVFWEKVVNPTWIEGSTTAIGYARVMADRIAAFRLAPDTTESEIEAATSRFVAMYLASSRIDPHWRPILARLGEYPGAITVVATDHYAEATEKIIGYLDSWSIPAKKIAKGGGLAFPSVFSEAEDTNQTLFLTPHIESGATVARSGNTVSKFFIANSADMGVWKADRRFWEILKSRLPLVAVRRILLIDDFGFNEEAGDSYGGQAKALARQEKTVANLRETFQAAVEVVPFYLPGGAGACKEAGAGLIAEAAARIDEFLERI